MALEPAGESVVQDIEDQTFAQLSVNLTGFSEEDISSFIKTAVHLQKILEPGMNTHAVETAADTGRGNKATGRES